MKTLTIDFNDWGPQIISRSSDSTAPGCCLCHACEKINGGRIWKPDCWGRVGDGAWSGYPDDIEFAEKVEARYGLDENAQHYAATLNDLFHAAWTKYRESGDSIYLDGARYELRRLRAHFREYGTALRILNLPEELR